MGETFGGVYLLTTWLIGIKNQKKIIFCDTKTVILLTIVIIINIIGKI